MAQSKILSIKHLQQLGTEIEEEPCLRIWSQGEGETHGVPVMLSITPKEKAWGPSAEEASKRLE